MKISGKLRHFLDGFYFMFDTFKEWRTDLKKEVYPSNCILWYCLSLDTVNFYCPVWHATKSYIKLHELIGDSPVLVTGLEDKVVKAYYEKYYSAYCV